MKIDGKPMWDRWVVMSECGMDWVLGSWDAFHTKALAITFAKEHDQPGDRYAVAYLVPSCYIEDGKVRPCD